MMALGATALILLGLWLAFFLEQLSSALGIVLSMAVIMGEISLPLMALERFQRDPKSLNMYAYRLETFFDFVLRPKNALARPAWPQIGQELIFTVILCAAVFVPYIAAYYGVQHYLAMTQHKTLIFSLNWPPMLIKETLLQLFVVAFPEEFFYRGFLQGALLEAWPNRRFVFGLPVGRAIIVTNLLFALGHLVSGFHPMRALTFFPGLIFSWIVYKRKNLLPAIIFLFMEIRDSFCLLI
ncbi:MAG: CAAX amino terminal protease self- immunity [bacterium ADurb.BinA186]|nr:MAG: CAAX amino terminal protease self- immunity [bacterium ADurb.BinA186]